MGVASDGSLQEGWRGGSGGDQGAAVHSGGARLSVHEQGVLGLQLQEQHIHHMRAPAITTDAWLLLDFKLKEGVKHFAVYTFIHTC